MLSLIHRALVHPKLPHTLLALSVLTALPALQAGWMGDDWAHRAGLGGHPPFAHLDPLLHLFRFLTPGELNDTLASTGLLTWWADMEVRAAFFRPLSALTHMLDDALWRDSAPLQHLHSLLWGAVMTVCAFRFLKEDGSSPLAIGLAAMFYAVEDAHAVPLSWLANRNALLTTTFAILSVHAFVRWRKTGSWRMWGASLVMLSLGLGAGEAALGACAWMAAWVLTRERPRALASLSGPAAVVLIWRLAYDAMGFGADFSGLYIDPGTTPGVWAGAFTERWPILAAGQLLSLPIDVWGVLLPPGRQVMTLISIVMVVGFGALAWPTLRVRPAARTAAVAFALILVPFTATFPMDRLFAFASLASAVILAEMIDHHSLLALPGPQPTVRSGSFRVLALIGLLLWHGPMSVVMRPIRCAIIPTMGLLFDVGADTAPRDPTLEKQTLVFVHASEFAAMYTFVKRSVPPHDSGRPEGVALLSSFWTDVTVTREDPHTLVLTPEDGFLSRPVDWLVRDPARAPFVADERIQHRAMEVHVRAVTEDGRPSVVAFRFADPLEDTTHRRFVHLTLEGVQPWQPPAIGETMVMPAQLGW